MLNHRKKIYFLSFRNGQTLGVAFNKIDEANVAFFPALTLSNEEYVSVNLGERPFKFPIPRAKPVIAYPTVIIDYYKRLETNINTFIDRHISLQSNVSLIYDTYVSKQRL